MSRFKFTKEQLQRLGVDPQDVKRAAAKARELAKAEREDPKSPLPHFTFGAEALAEAERMLTEED